MYQLSETREELHDIDGQARSTFESAPISENQTVPLTNRSTILEAPTVTSTFESAIPDAPPAPSDAQPRSKKRRHVFVNSDKQLPTLITLHTEMSWHLQSLVESQNLSAVYQEGITNCLEVFLLNQQNYPNN